MIIHCHNSFSSNFVIVGLFVFLVLTSNVFSFLLLQNQFFDVALLGIEQPKQDLASFDEKSVES
jgi:hypothetical protein